MLQLKAGVKYGIEVEDNVMIGSNTSFTNDLFPRSQN